MEQSLETIMDEMMQASDVRGVLLTDKTGMCLGSRGQGERLNPGGVDRLAKIAAKLDPNGRLPQMMSIQGENTQIEIQQREHLVGTLVKEVITAVPSN